jgi:hypothetical protein
MREEYGASRATRVRLPPKAKSNRRNEATPDRRPAELERAEVDPSDERDPDNEPCCEPPHQRNRPAQLRSRQGNDRLGQCSGMTTPER